MSRWQNAVVVHDALEGALPQAPLVICDNAAASVGAATSFEE